MWIVRVQLVGMIVIMATGPTPGPRIGRVVGVHLV